MNELHLQMCASDEWAEAIEQHIIPWTLEGVDLGDDVLEVGPGPGRTTDVLRTMTPRLTAVEVDADLATALAERMAGTNVEVVHADATVLPLPDGRFSAALSLSMLHHVPSAELQDALLGQVARVLRPGGVFAGTDGLASDELDEFHRGDVYVPVDPATLADRLLRAGFESADVDVNEWAVRFRARVRA